MTYWDNNDVVRRMLELNQTLTFDESLCSNCVTAFKHEDSSVKNSKQPESTVKRDCKKTTAECNCKTPEAECIMQNEKKGALYTTVKWTDGTYTTVKVSADDASACSSYMAFCAALAKKLYGSNAAVHRMVNRHMLSYIENEKKANEAKKRAAEKETVRAAHERAVLREAKRLRIKEEAKAYNRAHKKDEE